ncbi:hypothetical protein AAHE18_13G156300 [Arachis hypogaea]
MKNERPLSYITQCWHGAKEESDWYYVHLEQSSNSKYDVGNVKSIHIQTFHAMQHTHLSIALNILEQIKGSLSIGMSVFRMGSPPNTTTEASEWNGLFVGQNVIPTITTG